MGSFYTPNQPYDINTYIDNLPAYSLTEESYDSLELLREIIASEKYAFQGMPFPTRNDVYLPGYGTVSGNITVPPLSYLALITGDSFYTTTTDGTHVAMGRNLEGFTLRIYDKGAQLDTAVSTLYMENFTTVGYMGKVTNPGQLTNRPIGPNLPQSPMIVLIPGSLQVEITNLAAVPVYAQVLLALAVPVNRQSANQQIIGVGGNG